MKKIYRILFLLVALIGYSSCNYLDIVPDETTTDEDTYADKDAVRDYLYSCYAYLPQCNISSGSLDQMTGDEVITAFEHETFARLPIRLHHHFARGSPDSCLSHTAEWADNTYVAGRYVYQLHDNCIPTHHLHWYLLFSYRQSVYSSLRFHHHKSSSEECPTNAYLQTPVLCDDLSE